MGTTCVDVYCKEGCFFPEHSDNVNLIYVSVIHLGSRAECGSKSLIQMPAVVGMQKGWVWRAQYATHNRSAGVTACLSKSFSLETWSKDYMGKEQWWEMEKLNSVDRFFILFSLLPQMERKHWCTVQNNIMYRKSKQVQKGFN